MKNSIPRDATIVAVMALTCFAGDSLTIRWYTIDGGGGMSTGNGFSLSGTIGQPDAAVTTGDGFRLVGGFWFPIPPGDCGLDGSVDLFDFRDFHGCITGPGGAVDAGCACADLDGDSDVDLLDVADFLMGFSRD